MARTYTTPQAAAAVGVSGQTLRRWAAIGLLPAPERVFRGRRGNVSQWPESTVRLAQRIYAELESGKTLAQIHKALGSGEYSEET